MPFLVHCPTCHKPLTANESQVPYVVACPSCHAHLTVPPTLAVSAPVEQDPFALPSDTPQYRYKRRKKNSIGMTLMLSGVGLWCLSVLMLLIGYSGALSARDVNGVLVSLIPVYGGWFIAAIGTMLFFIGVLAMAVQAGVRDAKD